MRIKVGISNRHAHLTEADTEKMGINPQPLWWLGIGDNYASDTTIEAPNGMRFRVLLPFRSYSQIEVLASDCKALMIPPTYRFSGKLDGAPTLRCKGVDIPAIVALPHVHIPNHWFRGQATVRVEGVKDVVLRNVPLWPTPAGQNELPMLHVDKDEAQALALGPDTTITLDEFTWVSSSRGFSYTLYDPFLFWRNLNGRFSL